MKEKRALFIFGFFLCLSLLAAFTFFLPAKTFSENENRSLAQSPTFSGREILAGTFQTELSDYLSDQIPFREFWIQTNTFLKKLSGKKEINGVYLGKENYYFQQFTEESYSPSRMNSVFRILEEFVQEQSVKTTVLLVPTPGTVLKDKLPKDAPFYHADVVYEKAKELLSCPVMEVQEVFSKNEKNMQLYYRTDHHWTTQGAYLAYREYCKALGIAAKEQSYFQLEEVTDNFFGTLYSKVLDKDAVPDSVYVPKHLPKIQITYDDGRQSDSLYEWEFLSAKDKYKVFFGGNWGKVHIKTQAGNGKRLLIIKDSFANSFVPYLLEEFEEIILLDFRYYDGRVDKVVEEGAITEILFLYEMSNLLTDTGIIKLAE